jgi:hypothetical protein
MLVLAARTAYSQGVPVQTASPAYQGFRIPSTSGTLRYSVSASERISIGYNGDNQTGYSTGASGNVGFITSSVLYPTSVLYSGGYFSGSSAQPSAFYQTVSVAQTINRKFSAFTISDSLAYLPQSPSVGLAGLPGLGDLGANPNPVATQGLLTDVKQLTNAATALYTRKLTGSTSVSAEGGYTIQRFLGDSTGLETDAYVAGGQVQHRIDARSSFSAQYSYNNFTYVDASESFNFQSAVASYKRSLTRNISVSLGAGPEIIGGSVITGGSALYNYRLNGSLAYASATERGVSATLAFSRGTNGGQGASYGGESDSFAASASRHFGRSLGVAATFAYSKTTSLQGLQAQTALLFPSVNANAYTASVQANRAIAHNLSVYASYSLQRQTYLGTTQGISPLNGNVQVVAFGITYSPETIHLGRQ